MAIALCHGGHGDHCAHDPTEVAVVAAIGAGRQLARALVGSA